MKKYLLFFAAFALLLVGCAQNDIVENRSEKNAIGFNTLNDRVTRKANDAKDNYGVFTKWDGFTGWYMDNQKVVSGDTGDTYDPIRYWPNTGTVNFYAYAPHNSSNIGGHTGTTPNASLELTYTVHEDADEDFTVATPVEVTIDGTSGKPANSTVNLEFKHMLTKVSVKAELDAAYSDYALVLDNATVDIKVPHSVGKVDIMNASPALSNEGTEKTYNKSLNNTNPPEFLLIPQKTIDGQDKISIQLKNVLIKYNGENYFEQDLKTFEFKTDVLSGNKFEAGKHYAVKFTIKSEAVDIDGKPVFGDAIAFTSELTDWGNANGVDINQPADTTPPVVTP